MSGVEDPVERAAAHAQVLLAQGRYEPALERFRQALAQDPEDLSVCIGLAQCLIALDRYDEAAEASRQVVALEPEACIGHLLLARCELLQGRPKRALEQLDQAQRCDPDEPDVFAGQAHAWIDLRQWQKARAAAEAGLRLDPEHEACSNLRLLILSSQGDHDLSQEEAERALRRDPDDPLTQANAGWACLRRGDHRQARTFFQEALRLQPGNDWARSGLIEAIKAVNPLYRWMFRFLLWVETIPKGIFFAALLATVVLRRSLTSFAEANPAAAIPIGCIVYGIFAFFVLTMLIQPVSNLLLMLHPLGRYALHRGERRQAWVLLAGLAFLLGLCGLLLALSASELLFNTALAGVLILVPLSAAAMPARLRRWSRAALIATAALLGLALTFSAVVGGIITSQERALLRDWPSEPALQRMLDSKDPAQLPAAEQLAAELISRRERHAQFVRDIDGWWNLAQLLGIVAMLGAVAFTWGGSLLIKTR